MEDDISFNPKWEDERGEQALRIQLCPQKGISENNPILGMGLTQYFFLGLSIKLDSFWRDQSWVL